MGIKIITDEELISIYKKEYINERVSINKISKKYHTDFFHHMKRLGLKARSNIEKKQKI